MKCIANAYLSHKGKIVKPGKEISLTDEQVKRLGDKVKPINKPEEKNDIENSATEYSKTSLKEKSAEEQKEIVESLGGDTEELTNAEKRIQFIVDNQ